MSQLKSGPGAASTAPDPDDHDGNVIDMSESTRAARFWAKVDQRGPDECWPWTASRNPGGYGQFWSPEKRTMELAHRVAVELAGGVLPNRHGQPGAGGVLVLHQCDNPPCVNPAHLTIGTQVRNVNDCVARGRRHDSGGECNPKARLTAAQVRAIRESYTGRYGEKSTIARAYGISTGQVSKILLGQVWRRA